MIHYRLNLPRDNHVAACCGYWCADESSDWGQVDCPECLKIRDGVEVTDMRGRKVPAFNQHARTEWDTKTNSYRYVNTQREPSE